MLFGASCRSCASGAVPDEKTARAQATKAPKGSGLRTLFDAQESLQRREAARQRSVLVQRWNLLTDRYFRVLGALGYDATDAVDSAHFRFEALSKGVAAAQQQNDTIGLDESVRAGEETLSVLVRTARKSHPSDCEFQERSPAASKRRGRSTGQPAVRLAEAETQPREEDARTDRSGRRMAVMTARSRFDPFDRLRAGFARRRVSASDLSAQVVGRDGLHHLVPHVGEVRERRRDVGACFCMNICSACMARCCGS